MSYVHVVYLKETYGEKFNQVVAEYLAITSTHQQNQLPLENNVNALRINEITGQVETNNSLSRMNTSNIDWMKQYLTKGMIVLTKDAKHVIKHGHAGIMYDPNRSIEALGPNQVSQICNISYWTMFSCMRALKPKNTSNMVNAANYAYSNLRGWEYSALAPASSSSKVNCTTLVWKAYKAKGQNILPFDPESNTILPVQLDGSTELQGVANVGWAECTW